MKKIIIIGGGIAGLSAGVHAQKLGFSSEIYEQHTITGGQCTGWNRQGYHIDNCIHWLTGTSKDTMMYELWKDTGALGKDVKTVRPEAFSVYEFGGETITFYNDPDKLKAELLRIAPEDQKQIEELLHDVSLAVSMDVPANKPIDMYALPELMKLGMKMKDAGTINKKYGKMTCKEYAQKFSNPLLQLGISYLVPEYYCASALVFTLATVLSGNGDIPVGGSLAMAQRMQKKYESLGGKVITGAMVTEIMVEKNLAVGIKLEDGTEIAADYVIAACDVKYTLDKLLNNQFHDKGLEEQFEKIDHESGSSILPTSAHVAFAVDMDMKDYPVSLVFETEKYTVGVTEFNALGIRNYSYEPSFAPEGKTVLNTFISQSDQDYFWWAKLYEDKMTYEIYKEEMAKKIQAIVEKRFPELVGKLTLIDVYTPITYHRFCNSYHGAWMAFPMEPGDSAMMHNGKIKGLKNCFLAGMWLQSPGGLPVAAVTGKYAVQRICKCEKQPVM